MVESLHCITCNCRVEEEDPLPTFAFAHLGFSIIKSTCHSGTRPGPPVPLDNIGGNRTDSTDFQPKAFLDVIVNCNFVVPILVKKFSKTIARVNDLNAVYHSFYILARI